MSRYRRGAWDLDAADADTRRQSLEREQLERDRVRSLLDEMDQADRARMEARRAERRQPRKR
jgi:hypothetical protein